MSVNSRAKGARGELEAVKFLKGLGYQARRTQQYCGSAGDSDVALEDYPDLFIEVKFGYPKDKIDLGSVMWEEAIKQCCLDAGRKPWLLLWKPKQCREWRVTLLDRGFPVTVVGGPGLLQAMTILNA